MGRAAEGGGWNAGRLAGWAALALLAVLPLAAGKPSYAQLQAKAVAAQGAKRAELLAKLAAMDYALARQSYEVGQSAAGRGHLADMEGHAAEAMQLLQAETARGKKNGMKQVEIEFRQIAFGLADLEHTADYRDQAAIGAAQRRFSQRRQQLLAWMFASKKQLESGAAKEAA